MRAEAFHTFLDSAHVWEALNVDDEIASKGDLLSFSRPRAAGIGTVHTSTD